MKRLTEIMMVLLCLLAGRNAMAWDEVTHAHITQMAIEHITDPELKKLLKIHEKDFLFGAWYTDTYQYTGHRLEHLNPHILQWHTKAFTAYLQKPEVKKQANYERLMAFYLGSIAHTTEDFWLDYNLYRYPPDHRGDRVTGDTYNGVIDIARHGYLTLHIHQYLPVDDLYKIYEESGLLDAPYRDKNAFKSMIYSWGEQQAVKLRLLKLLSFLASDQVANASPWTVANMDDAPGGMRDCAVRAAAMAEASWRRVRELPVAPVLASSFIWTDSTLAVLTSYPVKCERIPAENVFVVSARGDTIRGRFEQMRYGNSEVNRTNMILKFYPEVPFVADENYRFFWLPGSYGDQNKVVQSSTYMAAFTAHYDTNMAENFAGQLPWWRTLGTGLFLFLICVALSGIALGMSGLVSFVKNGEKSIKNPWMLRVVNFTLQTVGVLLLLAGIYLLVTRGWDVVMNV